MNSNEGRQDNISRTTHATTPKKRVISLQRCMAVACLMLALLITSCGTTTDVGPEASAPSQPGNLSTTTSDDGLTFSWSRNTESDFERYIVYLGITSDSLVSIGDTVEPRFEITRLMLSGLERQTAVTTQAVFGDPATVTRYLGVETEDAAGNRSRRSVMSVDVEVTPEEGTDPDSEPDTDLPDIGQYSLTINANGQGNVSTSPARPSYAAATPVTLTAIPAEGWTFSGWSGDLSGSTNPSTLIMNGDKSVTATFTQVVVPPTETGQLDSRCLFRWHDSHQLHSVEWDGIVPKFKWKKLEHCVRLTLTGPVEIGGIAKSYVDTCINHGLHEDSVRHAIELVIAIGVDVLSSGSTGGAATIGKITEYAKSAADEVIGCLTDTARITSHVGEQLKAKFDATVRKESHWVYWYL